MLETEHGTQGFYIDVTPVHRSVRVIIDERCSLLANNPTKFKNKNNPTKFYKKNSLDLKADWTREINRLQRSSFF